MSLTTKIDFFQFFPKYDELSIAELITGVEITQGPLTEGPLVSGVLVHSNAFREDPRRRGRAIKAIGQWQRQSYRNKELIIVNSTGKPMLPDIPHPIGIKEVAVDGKPTIGAMRNIGIEAAAGAWIKPWDDDDIYGTRLVALLMAHRDGDKPVMLQCQVRVDFRQGTAFRLFEENGVPSTILYPKGEARYPDCDEGDDVAFEVSNFPTSVLVPNVAFPNTLASIAVFHGWNVTPRNRFLGTYAEKKHESKWYLSQEEIIELPKILEDFGLKTTVAQKQATVPALVVKDKK